MNYSIPNIALVAPGFFLHPESMLVENQKPFYLKPPLFENGMDSVMLRDALRSADR